MAIALPTSAVEAVPFMSRVRGPSAILLVVGSLGLMTSDIAYLTVRLYGTWHVGSPADLGWVVFYISWACAALHP